MFNIATCACALGVSKRKLEAWLAEGEQEDCEDELLLELYAAMCRGRAVDNADLSEAGMHHRHESPAVYLHEMKVRNPEWNIASKSESKTASVTIVPVEVRNKTPEERRAIRAEELKRLNEPK